MIQSQPPHTKYLTKRHLAGGVGTMALIAAIAFVVNGPVSGLFNRSISADEEPVMINPLPVNVAEVEFVESIQQSRSYTGTIRARNRSELGFELSGKIKTVFVDEGDVVEAFQVLAELDTETLEAQKSATLARLAQANSVMDELNAGPRLEQIKASRAAVAAAKSRFDSAQLNLQRRTRLRNGGAISAEEYDQALFAEKTAQANLTAAEEQLSELEAGTRDEKLSAQASAVRQLESAVKEIEVAITKSRLLAPFAGSVTRRYMDPGSIAQASVPVIKLVQQQGLQAWIGLPVAIVAGLEKDTRHSILIDGQSHTATVSAKIQELDPATRTQTVVFDLVPTGDANVISGQLCEILVTSTVDSSGCWIPNSALTKGIRGLWSVMVIVPEKSGRGFRAEKRDIEVIKTDSGRVLAKGTIETGDQIILNGVHRIAEGQLVVSSED